MKITNCIVIFLVVSFSSIISDAQSAYTKGENHVAGLVKGGRSSNGVLTRWDDLIIEGAKGQDVFVDIVFENEDGMEYDVHNAKKIIPTYESTRWESLRILCDDYEDDIAIPYGYSSWMAFARFRSNGRVIGESSKKFYCVFRNNKDQIWDKTGEVSNNYPSGSVSIGEGVVNTPSYNSYNNSSNSSSSVYSPSNSGSSRSCSGDTSNNKYNVSEQTAYNTDKRTYGNYDSMLSQYFAGNRKASISEVRNWQSEMKRLRTKWERKGKSFPHSSNESR